MYLSPYMWATSPLVRGTVASHRKPMAKENKSTEFADTGVMMNTFSFDPMIFYLFGSVLFLGLISGIFPSFQAYKNELSENLKIIT